MSLTFESKTTTFTDTQTILEICVRGTLLPGSEGNDEVARIRDYLAEELKSVQTRTKYVVLNFLDLDYVFGDAIASTWIGLLVEGIEVRICAKGRTAASLNSLIAISLPVEVLESVEDCYREFM